ncbi:S-ribosylhomocysteinase LuxS [Pseudoramibacter alactolyticus ATCC 23263]|uniref:S-ribosylhomocysteine lyase n=1 Tax=Pseudoramibacter alactolyticus ATCC 23263 TaxID=887929 RepID=E6ME56_9FIRM|nr:S-ribosylhomocysteine lyase [Pseudoramibacter alactolyticus]EFV02603.1 S-ribosylhomocysteinase LuxS [Pseudoramibacter alactolyticus ATCC 23263]
MKDHELKKIPSFTVNHLKLLRGIYVSRKDSVGDQIVTTFDIRMKEPNREPVMNTAECHTIEHLGATYLRNDPAISKQIIYFGPMGCRTGFYLVMKGDLTSRDIVPLITNLYRFMAAFEGDIPGAAAKDCGNYLDQNLAMAKYESQKFLTEVLENLSDANLIYPV